MTERNSATMYIETEHAMFEWGRLDRNCFRVDWKRENLELSRQFDYKSKKYKAYTIAFLKDQRNVYEEYYFFG